MARDGKLAVHAFFGQPIGDGAVSILHGHGPVGAAHGSGPLSLQNARGDLGGGPARDGPRQGLGRIPWVLSFVDPQSTDLPGVAFSAAKS